MSNGKAKWWNDLAMVRERLAGRAAALNSLAEAFKEVGNDKVAADLNLTVQVLRECAGTVSTASEEVVNRMGQLALDAQK